MVSVKAAVPKYLFFNRCSFVRPLLGECFGWIKNMNRAGERLVYARNGFLRAYLRNGAEISKSGGLGRSKRNVNVFIEE